MSKRREHGVAGNLVENDALGVAELAGLLHMPGNRLALAVGVSGEEHLLYRSRAARNLVNDTLFTFHHLVMRCEAVRDVYCLPIALGEIPDVANARKHLIALAKIL